ncbi:MAG: hypothetical protein PF450_05385, partial [Bacteroidales bacterium]|nr:hypothetical protein [Bacteroidales bacterium]
NDRQRCAVGGILFGHYADSIVYGALSLTNPGVPTYGSVHCRLRSVAIEKRTSFLETNSYKFIQTHAVVAGSKLPSGFFACWDDRQKLVLTKIADRLSAGQGLSDWQKMIIHSEDKKQENDEFIEAHIFEGFDWNAIESMVKSANVTMSRAESLDFDLAKDAFDSRRGKVK